MLGRQYHFRGIPLHQVIAIGENLADCYNVPCLGENNLTREKEYERNNRRIHGGTSEADKRSVQEIREQFTSFCTKPTILSTDDGGVLFNVSRLLSLPIGDISNEFRVPQQAFRKTKIRKGTLPENISARVDIISDLDANEIVFNQDYLHRLPEYLADVGIHEIGHVLTNYKTFLALNDLDNDLELMPGVPLSLDEFHGINEGFGELLRLRFSAEPNRFPGACKEDIYRQPILMDYDILLFILEQKTILDRFVSNHYEEDGVCVVPSILYYAQETGQYEELIKNYNKLIKMSKSGTYDIKSLQELGNRINTTFMDR